MEAAGAAGMMERRRAKERLIGASVLVVLIVLIVPELLSGPKPVAPAPEAPGCPRQPRRPNRFAPSPWTWRPVKHPPARSRTPGRRRRRRRRRQWHQRRPQRRLRQRTLLRATRLRVSRQPLGHRRRRLNPQHYPQHPKLYPRMARRRIQLAGRCSWAASQAVPTRTIWCTS